MAVQRVCGSSGVAKHAILNLSCALTDDLPRTVSSIFCTVWTLDRNKWHPTYDSSFLFVPTFHSRVIDGPAHGSEVMFHSSFGQAINEQALVNQRYDDIHGETLKVYSNL